MDMTQVHAIARRLVQAHGARAEAEAAQKLQAAEQNGDNAQQKLWRRVRATIKDRKAAHES